MQRIFEEKGWCVMDRKETITATVLLQKLGYQDTIDGLWWDRVQRWGEWYRGKTDFHRYRVYNGQEHIERERKTLNMARKVCEDKADLLLNERVKITLPDEALQIEFDGVLHEAGFEVNANQLIERANALGTGAFVEYLNNGKVCIDCIDADYIRPLAWQNGIITECAFVSRVRDITRGNCWYVNIHAIDNGRYVVRNFMFNEYGNLITLPANVLPEYYTGYDKPLFQIVRPNTANNIYPDIPMGVSAFANSIDILESIDIIYDSYANEFILGKKRIFVPGSMLNVAMKGDTSRMTPVFDPNDVVFHAMDGLEEKGKSPVVESNLELRIEQHKTGLQDQLDMLSEMVGFGRGYYRFDGAGVAKTATEIISGNSKLYRKIQKDGILITNALYDMARAVLFLMGKPTETEISIFLDDSIIEDTNAIMHRAMLEYNNGLIDKVQYFVQAYGMEKEGAAAFVKEMDARAPEPIEIIEDFGA